ncbi:DNA helicase UvrD [Candidatus Nomurabacteria bacterium]|nr:DNA helicase UvrD [Candidatus Nomurabacteria bacterium]
MQQILDLHIHSKYSRACSKHLELPEIARSCAIRGIDIVVTGDFTHPKWFEHIQESLVEHSEGVFVLKEEVKNDQEFSILRNHQTKFLLGTEVSVIKKDKGATRRVHHLVFAPSISVAEKFNQKLADMGFNLYADGRPILGITSKALLELMLDVDERMVMIPAHVWTPWFGIFGSKSGYDSLEEAFEDLTPHIFAIETGLSSDPLMNWQCDFLDKITLVSNSDAHSPQKLGREANVFSFQSELDITYLRIMQIIREAKKSEFLYTIEFYPEEGKYHCDGHRDCGFWCEPEQTKRLKGICPKCKKKLVVGVLNRVQELASRPHGSANQFERIPFKSIVPLPEIISDTIQVGVSSKAVKKIYDGLIEKMGSEFSVLIHGDVKEIEKYSSKEVANAIQKVREGDIYIQPGYDGEFGVVKVFQSAQQRGRAKQLGMNL